MYMPNGSGSMNAYIPSRRRTFDFVSDHLRFTLAANGGSLCCRYFGFLADLLVLL